MVGVVLFDVLGDSIVSEFLVLGIGFVFEGLMMVVEFVNG